MRFVGKTNREIAAENDSSGQLRQFIAALIGFAASFILLPLRKA